jgi:hypothetical protein
VDKLRQQFEEKTRNYSKQITEKFSSILMERFKPKIGKIVNELVEHREKQLEEVEFV